MRSGVPEALTRKLAARTPNKDFDLRSNLLKAWSRDDGEAMLSPRLGRECWEERLVKTKVLDATCFSSKCAPRHVADHTGGVKTDGFHRGRG